MAKNPSNRWSNKHACFTCASGNGKGILVTNSGYYPNDGCIAIYDKYGEYNDGFGHLPCFSFKTRKSFSSNFLEAWRSGKPFVVSYSPVDGDNTSEKDWFGELMWAASDGDRRLHLLFEEFGRCVDSSGKDNSVTGEIVEGGRKFGIRAGFVFQRSATVPKTQWGNTSLKYIGAQEFSTDCKRISEQLGCSVSDVAELGRLNNDLAVYSPKYDDDLKVKLHYMVSKGFEQYERKAAIVPPNVQLMQKWNHKQKELHRLSNYELMNPQVLN